MIHFTTNIYCSNILLMLHSANIPEPGLRWHRHCPKNGMGSWRTRPDCGNDLETLKQAFAVRTAAHRGLRYLHCRHVDMMRTRASADLANDGISGAPLTVYTDYYTEFFLHSSKRPGERGPIYTRFSAATSVLPNSPGSVAFLFPLSLSKLY